MREYETVYLLKPDLPVEQLSALKEKFSTAISKGEGHILSVGDWGKRKLAYDLKKNRYGHYIYLQYLSDGSLVKNLERLLKLDDSVLKFITVKLAEHVSTDERLKNKGEAPLPPEEIAPARPPESSSYRRGQGSEGSDRGGGDFRRSGSSSADQEPAESNQEDSKAADDSKGEEE